MPGFDVVQHALENYILKSEETFVEACQETTTLM